MPAIFAPSTAVRLANLGGAPQINAPTLRGWPRGSSMVGASRVLPIDAEHDADYDAARLASITLSSIDI